MNDDVKEFCDKYDAYVQPSHHMHRRAKMMGYDDWTKAPNILQEMPYEDLRCVEIHMPEDRFRALLEHDEWVERAGLQDNSFFNNNVARVSHMIVEHERECRIRQENPSVRAAWEKYQTLLKLVDSHYD